MTAHPEATPGLHVETVTRAFASLLGNDDPEFRVIGSRPGADVNRASERGVGEGSITPSLRKG